MNGRSAAIFLKIVTFGPTISIETVNIKESDMTKPNGAHSPDPAIIEQIRRDWGDVLGPYSALLDQPGGLDEILSLIRRGAIGRRATD